MIAITWSIVAVAGVPDATGHRPVTVHSRPDSAADLPWTTHATGLLTSTPGTPAGPVETWPPAGAEAVDLTGFYDVIAEGGFDYGTAFRGLGAAWRLGDDFYAEVALPESEVDRALRFGLHPALFDAAMHTTFLAGFTGTANEAPGLPFAQRRDLVFVGGLRLSRAGNGAVAVRMSDPAGQPVATVTSMVSRPVTATSLTTEPGADLLYQLEWQPLPGGGADDSRWLVLGDPATDGLGTPIASLDEAADGDTVVLVVPPVHPDHADVPAAVREVLSGVLATVQRFLAGPDGVRLIVFTEGAVSTAPGQDVTDLAGAAVVGLIRSAQSEHPDRIVLVDVTGPVTPAAVRAAAASGEPQVAVTTGGAVMPRVVRTTAALELPQSRPWRLRSGAGDTVESLHLAPEEVAPLGPGQVRVAVRASGVNFRDVLNVLGMYPGEPGPLGGEMSGVVVETGPGVDTFTPGDRVLGIVPGTLADEVVADARMVVPMPAGWTFAEAAAIPITYATAYYALVDLAGVRAGESVLVHAGAGGVGMAAVTLARRLGATVFSTASPSKQALLVGRGVDPSRVASSRDLEFEGRFLAASGGRGVDVVLNALAGEFVDASVRLLPRGGRFLEMGKTDVRGAGDFPGVDYRAFDLIEAGAERIGELLTEIVELLGSGELDRTPVRVYDIRNAPEAFRHLAQAKHVGKIVITIPAATRRSGQPSSSGRAGGSSPRTCSARKARTTSYQILACSGLSTQWFSSGK